MLEADVGQTALKVGYSVFGKLKWLGGMALDTAKSRVTGKGAGSAETPLGRGWRIWIREVLESYWRG